MKATRIERTAIIEDGAIIGKGCYIGHYTIIRPNVIIGDNSEIRAHCFIAEGAKIGNDSQIMQFSNICRGCIIEDNVFVGMNCITSNTRKIAYKRNYKDIQEAPIIKFASRLGARVTILPGVIIEENCLIGAGSVVTKNTLPRKIYIGSPAKLIGDVPDNELLFYN